MTEKLTSNPRETQFELSREFRIYPIYPSSSYRGSTVSQLKYKQGISFFRSLYMGY